MESSTWHRTLRGFPHLRFRVPTVILIPRAIRLVHVAILLVFGSRPACAQASGGLDVDWATAYLWHGLTLSDRFVVQPAAWAALRRGDSEIAGGLWSAIEPWRADAFDWTVAGRGERRLGEVDPWLQYTRNVSSVDLTLGVISHLFLGDEEAGGIGSGADAMELYVRVWPEWQTLPVEPRATLFYDPNDHAAFGEFSLSRDISLIPHWPGLVPVSSLLLEATTGGSLGATTSSTVSRPVLRSASPGLSYLDLAVSFTVDLWGSAYAHIGGHYQWNLDDDTRRTAGGRMRSTERWLGGGLSVPFGTRVRP